jgi:predicted metal-dependent hydrolase
MMPDKVKEYIIIHELIHTKILKHNQAFWLYLANIMPDYLNSVDWIKRHENVILDKY